MDNEQHDLIDQLAGELRDALPGEIVHSVMTVMAIDRLQKLGMKEAGKVGELMGLGYYTSMIDFALDKMKAVIAAGETDNIRDAVDTELKTRNACALAAAGALACMWELHELRKRAGLLSMSGETMPPHVSELLERMEQIGESLGIKVQVVRVTRGDDIADVIAKAIKGDANEFNKGVAAKAKEGVEHCDCGHPHGDAAAPASSTQH